MTLGVEVDEQDALTGFGECLGYAGGGCGLADAALLVAEDQPPGTGCAGDTAGEGWLSSHSRIDWAMPWL